MSSDYTCKICGEKCTSRSIGMHVFHKHSITGKQYYDKYLKSTDEEKCEVCGKICKWFSISQGYAKTCSRRCAQLNPNTRNKIKSTNIEKYGVEVPAQNKNIRKKMEQTNIERYGVPHAYQNENIKTKGIKTVQEKYGVDNVFQLEEVKKKSKKTMLDKYGVELNINREETKSTIKASKRKKYYQEFLSRLKLKNISYLSTYDEFMDENTDRKYKCEYCNKIFSSSKTQAYDIQCGCLRRRSKAEHKIYEWLLGLNIKASQTEYIYDSEGRLELDIVATYKGRKVAIEFCGIYWHSELFRDKNYHKRKLIAAEANGYRLIQVFEDEWNNSKEIVESIILQAIGYDTKSQKIHARKCKVVSLKKTPVDFLNKNHIQGKCRGSKSYALMHDEEIVSVIVFGKSRFKNEWECIRFCNLMNTSVRGSFGKLLNAFIKDVNPSVIVSYADLRYFSGTIYEMNGFIKEKNTPIGYFYCPKGFQERLNRMRFQKHKLKNMPSYDINKTESQIMHDEGYTRIYDAGQAVYRLHI